MGTRKFLMVMLFILLAASFFGTTGLQVSAQVPTPVPAITRNRRTSNASSKVSSFNQAAAIRRGNGPLAGYVLPPGVKPAYVSPSSVFGVIPQPVADTVVTITGGGGSGASARALVSGITSLKLESGGFGYTSAPAVSFLGGGGTGAAATVTILGGAVVSLTLTSPGSGYLIPPAVVFSGGGVPIPPALATASVAPGAITAIQVTNPGSGYRTAPLVTITGSGKGAVAVATLTAGQVTGIKVIFPGVGYALGVSDMNNGASSNAPTP